MLVFKAEKRGLESKNVGSLLKVVKVKGTGPTLVVRWLRICLPVQEMLEKATAPHSSTLAWKIPWKEDPGRLQSVGLLRVRRD